jgi:hypothetical protein
MLQRLAIQVEECHSNAVAQWTGKAHQYQRDVNRGARTYAHKVVAGSRRRQAMGKHRAGSLLRARADCFDRGLPLKAAVEQTTQRVAA